jgi:hypothetical protein
MSPTDASALELAKLWAAAAIAFVVALVGFAANLVITLMRTGRREMAMRHYESELKVKADLRLKLFGMQIDSVREFTVAMISALDALDD